MNIQSTIEKKLAENIECKHLEVVNESSSHNVPPGSESHFKVIVVSSDFDEMKLITRHRKISALLADELSQSVHALAIHTYTELEWHEKNGDAPMSPPCLGS